MVLRRTPQHNQARFKPLSALRQEQCASCHLHIARHVTKYVVPFLYLQQASSSPDTLSTQYEMHVAMPRPFFLKPAYFFLRVLICTAILSSNKLHCHVQFPCCRCITPVRGSIAVSALYRICASACR